MSSSPAAQTARRHLDREQPSLDVYGDDLLALTVESQSMIVGGPAGASADLRAYPSRSQTSTNSPLSVRRAFERAAHGEKAAVARKGKRLDLAPWVVAQ